MRYIYCIKCKKDYPFTKKYFYIRKHKKVRDMQICKKCTQKIRTIQIRNKYRNNPEYRRKTLERGKKYRNNDYHKKYLKNLNEKIRDKLGIGYIGLHQYITNKKTSKICEICGIKYEKLTLHCIEHNYTRDLLYWLYLCRKCHTIENNNIKNNIKSYIFPLPKTIKRETTRKKLICNRCNYKWISYIENPKRCPKCKSSLWNNHHLTQLQCNRCKHKWLPKILEPKQCPKCQSPYWNTPKTKKNLS